MFSIFSFFKILFFYKFFSFPFLFLPSFHQLPKISSFQNILNSTPFPINASLTLHLHGRPPLAKGDTPSPLFAQNPSQFIYLHLLYKNQILYKLPFTILFSFFTSPSQSLTPNHLKAFTISFSRYHTLGFGSRLTLSEVSPKDLVGDIVDNDPLELVELSHNHSK